MTIKDLMTPGARLVDPNTTVRDAAIQMRDADIGALPVGENDRLAGMVTDRDIVVRGVASDLEPTLATVRDVMSEGVYYCFENDDVDRAANLMAEHKVRRLPVLDSNKRLVGVLALADLARAHTGQSALRGVSEQIPQERL
ncbi:CBS domain-containing protein [Loktanella sp. SALINAS62]|uniref:CBS domain-containing protein n=1 Tax=Loktanella sp. SALINAS62 TaxID=2706124 RepID=UPI002011BB75|nr:CBS domain-containing protein [Loktanella sp. SALINAS62]MBS1303308.1 CBS domain-containing protein [Loktanella sp. SALINAS62]